MRMVPHKSELGRGLKNEPNGWLFVIASLLSVALLLLMFSSARATRGEIPPAEAEESRDAPTLQVPSLAYAEIAPEDAIGAAGQPNSVAAAHRSAPSRPADKAQSSRQSALAALLDVMAGLGGASNR
jgi:hypothetical protein